MKNVGKKKAIVYIDGFNLYYGIRELRQPSLKWLDIQGLGQSFLAADTELVAVKYFTAQVTSPEHKQQRQKIFLSAIAAYCDKVCIVYGYFLPKSSQCRHCGHNNNIPEEKKTDVNIACAIMEDTYESRFDIAYVVSGDSDLVPPVEKAIAKGKVVIVASPPNRKSKELNNSATGYFNINPKRFKEQLVA